MSRRFLASGTDQTEVFLLCQKHNRDRHYPINIETEGDADPALIARKGESLSEQASELKDVVDIFHKQVKQIEEGTGKLFGANNDTPKRKSDKWDSEDERKEGERLRIFDNHGHVYQAKKINSRLLFRVLALSETEDKEKAESKLIFGFLGDIEEKNRFAVKDNLVCKKLGLPEDFTCVENSGIEDRRWENKDGDPISIEGSGYGLI